MSHVVPHANVIGFDCRECGHRIPVYAGSRRDAVPIDAAIFIMCPDCGHAGRYASGEAYRFGDGRAQGRFPRISVA
jgi:hypothetical protein